MSDREDVYRRLLRRETHSPRSGPASVVAAVLALLLIAAIGLSIWWAVDRQFRSNLSAWWAGIGSTVDPRVALIIGAIVAVIIGLLLLLAAVLPGGLARHARATDRFVVVIDDGVLADAAADAVAYQNDLDRSQVRTTIGRRALDVRVTPTSGLSIDEQRVASAASAAVTGAGFSAATAVHVADRGVIA